MTVLSEPPSSLPPRSLRSLHHSSSLLSAIQPPLLPIPITLVVFPSYSMHFPPNTCPICSSVLHQIKHCSVHQITKEIYRINILCYCQGTCHAHLQSWKKCCVQFCIPQRKEFLERFQQRPQRSGT